MKTSTRPTPPYYSIGKKRRLCLAIAVQLFAATAHAGPTGGEIVGGDGSINQTGLTTTINQTSDRLAIDWQSFNVARDERVTFVQPGQDAIALNRIIGNEGSRIHGRIDANGHVILMNTNGVFFGADAVVNVGGLVATGLNINASDFLNGDLLLEAVRRTAGTVINHGLINAATGGNVALIGTQVTNTGLITARLGHVALVSGRQAVVTFDDQGLLGVAIDQETLLSQLLERAGVDNTGTINAESGRILLSGSVSQNLFSRAVNSGGMNPGGATIVHEDGSFTLGASVSVVNSGELDVSSANNDSSAGEVIFVGSEIFNSGVIMANHADTGDAGNIHLQSQGSNVRLSGSARVQAIGGDGSGSVLLAGGRVTADTITQIDTTGDTAIYGNSQILTSNMRTHNATLRSTGTISQSRLMNVSGNLHLEVSGGQTNLTHELNNIRQLSANIRGSANVTLSDSNGLQLGDTHVENATVRITAAETLRQSELSKISVTQSSLYLQGRDLDFNGDDGSTIQLLNGNLNAHFTHEAKLLNVKIPGSDNTGRVYLSTPGARGFTTLGRQGFGAHVKYQDYDLDGSVGLHIEHLNSLNTTIYSSQDVTQATAIFNDGALNLHLKDGGGVYFNNPENQFRRADMNLSNGSTVELVDANSLYLGNIQAVDSDIKITALAPDAFIRQANNTTIVLNDSTAAVTADIVLLGHNNNNSLKVNGSSNLEVNFTQQAHVLDTGLGRLGNNTQVIGTYTLGTVNASGSGGSRPFLFNAKTSDTGLYMIDLIAHDASINSTGLVRQWRGMQLDGNLHLDLSSGAIATLTHADNNFNMLSMNLGSSSLVRLFDRNNLRLGNLNLENSNAYLTATSVSQEDGSTISLNNSRLYFNTEGIFDLVSDLSDSQME